MRNTLLFTILLLMIVSRSMAAGISGTLSVCEGAVTTLSGTPSGGTWSSGSTSVATIGISNGVVSGLTHGTSTITYTYTSGGGGTVTVNVTVNHMPGDITSPTGVYEICQKATSP